MRNAWAVCKRELRGFFTTPVGYVVLGAFALITGMYFARAFILYAAYTESPDEIGLDAVPALEEWMVSPYLVLCGQIIMFLGPLITMRLLAEERNRGTMELLLTYPLTDREIVWGKYLASVCLVCIMTCVVVVHLSIVYYFTEIEFSVLVFGVLTVILMGSAFTSMGLFVSALSSNQITAGVLTFALWLGSYITGRFAEELPEGVAVSASWPPFAQDLALFAYQLFRAVMVQLPLDAHAEHMAEGVVEPRDVAYYLIVIAFFLFLSMRAVESRRWRA